MFFSRYIFHNCCMDFSVFLFLYTIVFFIQISIIFRWIFLFFCFTHPSTSKAYGSVAADLGAWHADINHGAKQFSRFEKTKSSDLSLPLRDLAKQRAAAAKQLSVQKKPAQQKGKRKNVIRKLSLKRPAASLRVTVCTNSAEGWQGSVTQNLSRRARNTGKRPQMTAEVLAAAHLLTHPGFLNVVSAVAEYTDYWLDRFSPQEFGKLHLFNTTRLT